MNARARLLGSALRHVGETAVEFFERALEARVESQIGKRARTRDEERPNLFFGEVGERAPIPIGEHDSAVRAAFRIDGNAGRAERVNIAIDRALRNFEPARQFASRTLAARLQKQ